MIVTSPKNNIQKDNIYGNALEALIGAIYSDKGYKKCHQFIKEKIFDTKHINIEKLIQKEINFKSRLLEFSQKNKMELTFQLVQQRKINGGQRIFFETEAVLNKIIVATGTGYSKKESQQNAAHAALKKLKKDNDLIERIKKNKSRPVIVSDESTVECCDS
jgi:ribonuclease-3